MADMITQLGLILLASVVFMLLALRLKLPPVVGLLLAGAIIGPNMLGIVDQSEYINIFADIGAILLLFFVGIKFSVGKIANVGLRSFIIWLVKDGFVFIVVYEASLLLGLNGITSIILASTLAISSTTFFIKLVDEKNASGSPEANLVFVVLIIEDLLAIFLLAVYSGMTTGRSEDGGTVLISILKATLVLAITTYFVLQKVTKVLFERLVRWNSDEVVLFFSMSFAILLSLFASYIGLAPSIGAFLAGNLLSSVKGFNAKTQETLSNFSMLFSAFFFISIGMLVSPESMMQNIVIIGVLYALVTGSIFISTFSSSYLLGYKGSSAVRAGLFILAIGEFSLLIAKQTKTLVAPFDIVSVTSALVFLTALSGGILIQYDKSIDVFLRRFAPRRIHDSGKNISLYLNKVLEEFEPPHGSVYSTFAREASRSVLALVFLVIIAGCAILGYNISRDIAPEYSTYVAGFAALVLAVPLAGIILSAKKVVSSLAGAFHHAMGDALDLDDMAMLYSAVALFMFIAAFIIPLAVAFLSLPSVFGLVFLIPLVLSLLFLWNLAVTVKKIMFRQYVHHYEMKRASFKPPYRHMIGEMRTINQPVYRGHKR